MHKLEKKVILIDVDGTLVDYENHLPPFAVKATRMARAQEHLVYICTGRSRSEVCDEIWNTRLDGMIGANDGYIEHHGEVSFRAHLKKEQCSTIIDWLHSRNLELYLKSNTSLYANEHFEEARESVIQKYVQRKGNGQENIYIYAQYPDMVLEENLYREGVNKINFILNSHIDATVAAQFFPDLKISTWGGEGEAAFSGDIRIQGTGKATAISLLLRHLHTEQKNMTAFGDAVVDISMLEYCALGIVMVSGGKEIKVMADDIIVVVNEDRLYKAFLKYNLLWRTDIAEKMLHLSATCLFALEINHYSLFRRQRQNVDFYAESCGFHLRREIVDGDMEMASFYKINPLRSLLSARRLAGVRAFLHQRG